MKTINKPVTNSIYFLGLVLSASLLMLSIPLGTAHALSCLNPTEMIDEYIADDRVAIALIIAGELETEGDEHNQKVTTKENLKGSTESTVTFAYDETWDYLCAGSPVKAGAEAVYVTNNGNVTQVIDLGSPLYDSLMSALDEAPTVANPTPTTEDETKRTLMLRIVDLLQQVVSLLLGEPTPATDPEPDATAGYETLVGMTRAEAEAYAEANDVPFRVVEIDGEQQPVTKDYRPGRINASIDNGTVVSYEIEGEESTKEGAHDDIIGMTRAEAEAYAETNDAMFRVGRIDDEFLPLTMDFRPGRITAEIEDGVIVDYSVEAPLSL